MSLLSFVMNPWRKKMSRFMRRRRHRREIEMHGQRHLEVRQRLQGTRMPASILVLCHANICRSPYLAAVLAEALPGIRVRSAGFMGGGRRVPPHSITIAQRRGLDLSSHRSQSVTRDLLATSELVIVMDERQAASLERGFGVPHERIIVAGDLDPRDGERRGILDPWRQPLSVYETSFARLDRCAESFVASLNRTR